MLQCFSSLERNTMLPSLANSLSNVVAEIIQESNERSAAKEELRTEIERLRREREQATNTHQDNMSEMRQRLSTLR